MKRVSVLAIACLFHSATTIANDVGVEGTFDPNDGEAWELGYGYYPYRSYQTTDIISPQFRTLVDTPECHDDRYVFFTPRGPSIAAPGPMIVDSHGDLIWAKSTGGQAYGLAVQEYKGEDYLTYWTGDDRVRGHGAGDYYMVRSVSSACSKIKTLTIQAQLCLPRSTQDLGWEWSSCRSP
jgi:hypothetical protein